MKNMKMVDNKIQEFGNRSPLELMVDTIDDICYDPELRMRAKARAEIALNKTQMLGRQWGYGVGVREALEEALLKVKDVHFDFTRNDQHPKYTHGGQMACREIEIELQNINNINKD